MIGLDYGQYPIIFVIKFGYSMNSSILRPFINISPCYNSSSPSIHLKVVDFPAPFVPSKLKHSFFYKLKDIPSIAYITPDF